MYPSALYIRPTVVTELALLKRTYIIALQIIVVPESALLPHVCDILVWC